MSTRRRFFLDYIDDTVASKTVNTLSLVAVLGPLFFFLFLIQTQIDTYYAPVFYMLGWFILPSLVCLFLLVPLQLGNNNYTNTSMMMISTACCILLFAFETYTCYILVTASHIPWFYFIALFTSVLASLLSALYYIYIILANASYRTYAEEREEAFDDEIVFHGDSEDLTALQKGIHSYILLIRELFWPSIPYMKNNYSIAYPSRLVVTVFLSLAGVIGCNELLTYVYIWTGEQLYTLSVYIDTLEGMGADITSDDAIAAHAWSIAVSKLIYTVGKPICDALLICTQIGLFCGIFGSVTLLRQWKQHMVYMRYSYGIDGKKWSVQDISDYPLRWSAKFISSVACSIIFGSVMIAFFLSVVYGLIVSVCADSVLVDSGIWRYIVCFLSYYVLESVIFGYVLMRMYCGNEMNSKYASVIMMINDLTNIPLAVLFCFVKIVQSICLCVFSFIRPDLSIFPGYLATLDHAHLSFISSVRLSVVSEANYATRSVGSMNRFGSNVEIHKINGSDSQS
eukprot:589901_1